MLMIHSDSCSKEMSSIIDSGVEMGWDSTLVIAKVHTKSVLTKAATQTKEGSVKEGRKHSHMLLWVAPGTSNPEGSELDRPIWTVPIQGSWMISISAVEVCKRE